MLMGAEPVPGLRKSPPVARARGRMALAANIVEELWFADVPPDAPAPAARRFAERIVDLCSLKPFPAVARRVLALLSDPDFRVNEVRATIEEDPALAGRVLRLANSAAFAAATPCDTVGRAIVRLGAATVRELVLALATMGLFEDATGRGAAVRAHCVAVGTLARVLARGRLPSSNPGVFLAGLMHDVGKLMLLQSREFPTAGLLPEERLSLEQPDGSHEIERRTLGYDHAVLGGHAVLHWTIPFPTPQVVAWHHQPERAADDDTIGAVIAVVRLADHLDRVLVAPQPATAADVAALAATPEAVRLGLDEPSLAAAWSGLHHVKLESTSLLAPAPAPARSR